MLGILHSFLSPILSALYERLLQRDYDVWSEDPAPASTDHLKNLKQRCTWTISSEDADSDDLDERKHEGQVCSDSN